MGQTQSTQVTALNEVVSNNVFNSIRKSKTECQTSATAQQEQTISVGTSNEVMLGCLDVAGKNGWSPSVCQSLMSSGLNVSNVKQALEMTISTSCTLTNEDSATIRKELTADLQAKVDKESDSVGEALKALASIGGRANTKTETKNYVQSQVEQTFTTENCNKLVQNYLVLQKSGISLQNAKDSSISGVFQDLRMKAMAQMAASNTSLIDALDQVSAKATSDTKQKDKGLTDLVGSLTGMVSGIASTYGKVMIAVVVGLLLCCCASCVGLVLFTKEGGLQDVSAGIQAARGG